MKDHGVLVCVCVWCVFLLHISVFKLCFSVQKNVNACIHAPLNPSVCVHTDMWVGR